MSTAAIYRIKAAQQQLVALCGGIDDDELQKQAARSTLNRWANTNDPTLMPLNALIAMERMCGRPVVTAALAELAGRRLSDPDAETVPQVHVMTRHADAIVQAGELMAAGAAAFADGKVTPNEAAAIDRAAAQLERGLAEYRKALAGIRADGGLRVVGE